MGHLFFQIVIVSFLNLISVNFVYNSILPNWLVFIFSYFQLVCLIFELYALRWRNSHFAERNTRIQIDVLLLIQFISWSMLFILRFTSDYSWLLLLINILQILILLTSLILARLIKSTYVEFTSIVGEEKVYEDVDKIVDSLEGNIIIELINQKNKFLLFNYVIAIAYDHIGFLLVPFYLVYCLVGIYYHKKIRDSYMKSTIFYTLFSAIVCLCVLVVFLGFRHHLATFSIVLLLSVTVIPDYYLKSKLMPSK